MEPEQPLMVVTVVVVVTVRLAVPELGALFPTSPG
jgi:hypothetical protein